MVSKYKQRLANEVAQLARKIFQQKGSEITLLSLARAGTPIGVLLTRALKYYFNANVTHYSISIVRDKGIDEAALEYIEQQGHSAGSILFVDGWTAKGVIAKELKASVAKWNKMHDFIISDELCVISDIGGVADIVATTDDYSIPSGILNSTVSGLVSRTILLKQYQGFHQCVYYSHLEEHDLSNWFVDQISSLFLTIDPKSQPKDSLLENSTQERNEAMLNYVNKLMARYEVQDINRVKPGIAEATRVMLRRIPRLLLVRDLSNMNISHLLVLADEKNIQVVEDKSMPFNAVAIIADVK